MKQKVTIPSVQEIIQTTEQDYDAILHNIQLINACLPSILEEGKTNTNMSLLLKRYVNHLGETTILLNMDDLIQVHKLIGITDNITNATFNRVTELLRIQWFIRAHNPVHHLDVYLDPDSLFDPERGYRIALNQRDRLSQMLTYILNCYGEVDLKQNTRYVPSYSVNNILMVIRGGKPISSYLFEKFMKLWNISYQYRIRSVDDPSVELSITMDPSQWI